MVVGRAERFRVVLERHGARLAYPSGKDAALDFYNVHYYDWMYDPSWGYDPCRLKAEAWALDKPTVIAELPASSAHYSAAQLLSCSSDNGFAGDLFWAYNDASFPLDKAVPAMKDFAAAHKDATSYSALLKWLGALGTAAAPPTPRARVAAASADAAAEATVEAPRRRRGGRRAARRLAESRRRATRSSSCCAPTSMSVRRERLSARVSCVYMRN